MGNYILTTDVNVKPVADSITRAGWATADIERGITESENYIESQFVMMGYTRAQLQNINLVDVLMLKYAWYVIIRDIYTQNSPSLGKTGGEPYNKWKDDVDEAIQMILDNKIKMVDNSGMIVEPSGKDLRYVIAITTDDTPRAITMDVDSTWSIDRLYSTSDIIGAKK